MKAARWLGRNRVEIQDVPSPVPRVDEALVTVEWVGLCGSDTEEYLRGPVQISGPVTLGHEIVGVVAVPAADGSGPATGTRVVVDVVTGCGTCYWCMRHEEGLCPALVVTGQHVDGGLAEYVTGRAARLIPVPDGLEPRQAALAEPLSVAVRAVRKAGALQGRGVLVIGGGTVGMLTAQVTLAAGADRVVVVEPAASRREVLSNFGCSTVWHPTATGRAAAISREFPARGADVVLECSGRAGMTAEAVRLARRGGSIVLLSVLPEDEPIDTLDLVLGEKVIWGSAAHMWDDDVKVAVSLLASGRVSVEHMITHELPLDEVPTAFELLIDPSAGVTKLLIAMPQRLP